MKYFKYIFVILLMFIMSGCSIDYTLFISDKGFDETIKVNVIDNLENTKFVERDYNPLHYSDDIIYDKDVKKGNENIDVKLHYNYSLEEFSNANSFNQAFYKRKIKITKDIINIDLSELKGLNVGVDFDIKIKTNNKVLSNNADTVKGNTYIWHVDDKNKENVNVKIKIKRGILNKKDNSNIIVYIVLGIIMVSSIAIAYFTYKRRKKSNQF